MVESRFRAIRGRVWGTVLVIALSLPIAGCGQDSGLSGAHAEAGTGSIVIDGAEIPFSGYASAEAKEHFVSTVVLPQPSLGDDIEQLREYYGTIDGDRAKRMKSMFAVDVEADQVAGVPVQIVQPQGGVPDENSGRVLINLHGGAFLWGSGNGGLVESIPIASVGGFRVIAVDYRLAPEHRFPAASEDAAAVYAELLTTYESPSIGIYGCSAGGILTAQVVAWIDSQGLPLPGAIGTFCGTGLEFTGDSSYLASPMTGHAAVSHTNPIIRIAALPYFDGVSAEDPLVFPAVSDELLARFPPTLLIAGGRDFAASSLTTMHRRLARSGVRSQLFIFDGLWHAFFMDPELPESREVYGLVARFFETELN